MALTRCLAPALLVAALAAGCSQSLFDADPGGGGPGRDGGNLDPDGGVPLRDGGDGEEVDAGSPPLEIDDAVGGFLLEPGGASGNWGYVEIQPGPEDTAYIAMQPGSWSGLDAWVSTAIDLGTGLPRSAIVNCAKYQEELVVPADCVGVGDRLLFISTSDAHRPALQWKVPATSGFTLLPDWVLVQGALAPGAVLLARNHRFDSLYDGVFTSAGDTDGALALIDAAKDDVFVLTTRAGGSTGVRVGVSFQIVPVPPGATCQMMTRFEDDGSGAVQNLCPGGRSFSEEGSAGAEPPPGVRSNARLFTDGSFMQYQGDPLDYSIAWTVQFWARLDGASGLDQWLLSDIDCTQQSGLAVRYDNPTPDSQTLVFETAYPDQAADYCAGQPVHFARIPAPTDEAWHFYRMTAVGESGNQTVQVCMDGQRMGEFPAIYDPMEAGIPAPLELGRRAGFTTSFRGELADLGVYLQDRPCPAGP